MSEPFKSNFNKKLIKEMALHLKQAWPDFDQSAFIKMASKPIDQLELKARSEHITHSLIEFLPTDFAKAGKILLRSLGHPLEDNLLWKDFDKSGITGWGIMPLTHFVGLQGQDHFILSMDLLKEMTQRFSSEFDIRYFLIQSPKKTLKVLKKWSKDKSPHVRRLASEGSRPRLPWAAMLPDFINDPLPVIEILEILKDDESEYVRRSVANNLNDISKDHPEIVVAIVKRWLVDTNHERDQLIRHGCRTLIKAGNQKILNTLGYKTPKLKDSKFSILNSTVQFGSELIFKLDLTSSLKKDQKMIIDYIIHYQKANGTTAPKVYKWKVCNLARLDTVTYNKKHKIKKISTRIFYPGLHFLEIIINGTSIGRHEFHLNI